MLNGVLLFTVQTLSASANVMLVARSLGLPLATIEKLVKSSVGVLFCFLIAVGYSVTENFFPALFGTALYMLIEHEKIAEAVASEEEKVYKDATHKQLTNRNLRFRR